MCNIQKSLFFLKYVKIYLFYGKILEVCPMAMAPHLIKGRGEVKVSFFYNLLKFTHQ